MKALEAIPFPEFLNGPGKIAQAIPDDYIRPISISDSRRNQRRLFLQLLEFSKELITLFKLLKNRVTLINLDISGHGFSIFTVLQIRLGLSFDGFICQLARRKLGQLSLDFKNSYCRRSMQSPARIR